jgi:peroxiredoxin
MKNYSHHRLITGLLFSLALAAGRLTATATEPPPIGAVAPDFTLKTMDAKAVTLSVETATLPVVLVVLRGWPGYQCPLCTRQVHELVSQADAFAGKGRVILVYPGKSENLLAHADEFLKDKSWPKDFLFVTDPDYTFTKSYGLRWEALGETSYPSTFVIDKKGKVQFVKISKTHGGRATSAEILAALAQLQ